MINRDSLLQPGRLPLAELTFTLELHEVNMNSSFALILDIEFQTFYLPFDTLPQSLCHSDNIRAHAHIRTSLGTNANMSNLYIICFSTQCSLTCFLLSLS